MIKRQNGFSLLELLIVMLIMGFVLAAASDMFVSLLRGYKQQSKIAETNIEGIIGLDLLRRDIESAGYGLPWVIPSGTTFSEAAGTPASDYNDPSSSPPRALLAGDFMTAPGYVNGSDYLVIKSVDVATNTACTKWNYLPSSGILTAWTTASDNPVNNDRIIVLSPGTPDIAGSRTLVAPTGDMASTPSALLYSGASAENDTSGGTTRIIYGLDPDTNLRRPFNRADYYVGTTGSLPRRCAPGTGILYKAVLNQGNGNLGVPLPLLDCVADMQVVTWLDTDPTMNPGGDTYFDGLSPAVATNAETIRNELKEVRVYVLAHEGQRDTSYSHPSSTIRVGFLDGATLHGRDFNLTAITNWQNYRWKVYTLVIDPYNLR